MALDRRWAAALTCVALVCCARAPRRDLPIVRRLEIIGARLVPEKELRERILTRETGRGPWAEPRYFELDEWRADLLRIERYYEVRGFYQARVVEDEVIRLDGEVALRVRIEEGLPTRVTDIELRGLEPLDEEQRRFVLEQFPFRRGDILEEQRWEGLRERLQLRLQELGFAEAVVEGEVRVDPQARAATMHLTFRPGRRYRFGELIFATELPAGETRDRILALARAAAPEEDWFSRSALTELQTRVFRTGLFGTVRVAPGEPSPESRTVPIVIDAILLEPRSFRVGGGVGLSPSRNELRGLAEYVERDFLGGLRTLRLEASAGYALVPNLVTALSSPSRFEGRWVGLVNAELEQPFAFESPALVGFLTLGAERGLEEAYAIDDVRSSAGLVWQLREALALRVSYQLQGFRLGGRALLGTPPAAPLLGCERDCALSFLDQRVEWDRRNDPSNPRRGYLLSLRLQEGGGPLGGFGFVRVQPEARGYLSLAERWTVASRLTAGTLIPLSTGPSPVVIRFFSGGSDSMRGFSHRRLSPLLVLPEDPQAVDGVAVPVGGHGLLEASVELQYAASGPLELAAFVDLGTVTVDSLSPRRALPNLHAALGVGARYHTLVGPLRVDLAYRLPVGPALQVSQLPGNALPFPREGGCFGLGAARTAAGAPEGACVLHLSFGEAF